MKKVALATVSAMIISLTFAQKNEVPALVKTAFQKQYPTAKEVKWDKEGDKYEASFELKETEQSVLFDASGNVLETEIEIEQNQLPVGVLEYVKAHYKNQPVKETEKITNSKGVVTYEVEIKGLDLLFDSNGKFIKENRD